MHKCIFIYIEREFLCIDEIDRQINNKYIYIYIYIYSGVGSVSDSDAGEPKFYLLRLTSKAIHPYWIPIIAIYDCGIKCG